MPTCRAMATAVVAWSPVIMIGRMPAALASATACTLSSRAGSMIPHSPASVRPCLNILGLHLLEARRRRQLAIGPGQHPQRLRGHLLIGLLDLPLCRSCVNSTGLPSIRTCEQNRSTRSGAPLTYRTRPRRPAYGSASPCTCGRWRKEARRRGASAPAARPGPGPLSSPRRSSPPSLGLPSACHRPSTCRSLALFATAPIVSSRWSASEDSGRTGRSSPFPSGS